MASLEDILEQLHAQEIDVAQAVEHVRTAYFQEIEGTTIDIDRQRRTGQAEVIYGKSKSVDQLLSAFQRIHDNGNNVLATRVSVQAATELKQQFEAVAYSEISGIATLIENPPPVLDTYVGVISAGTSDLFVSEEVALTAEFYGSPVRRIHDVGVAGLHRLLARVKELGECRVLVVVAGMEGALPSVVGGLVDKPVIAVPTSVGYGASFDGLAALLGMLNSCASGVTVVNIDNGFGAGFQAHRINSL